MKKYRIIDIHAHIYPDSIAKKAVGAIGDFYGIPMDAEGTSDALIRRGSPYGVSKYVVHSVATLPEQTQHIDEFIKRQMDIHPEFIGFAALHPDSQDLDRDFESLTTLGLRGIKLHPDFQRFNIDDKKAFKIYKRAIKFNLPVLIHMGDNRYDFSAPKRLRAVKEKLPELTVIAAHLGGYQIWNQALEDLKNLSNIYFDTSSSLYFLDKSKSVNMIREYGVENVLFGTDFPMWDFGEELDRFMNLNLSDAENEMILYSNAARLLKL